MKTLDAVLRILDWGHSGILSEEPFILGKLIWKQN